MLGSWPQRPLVLAAELWPTTTLADLQQLFGHLETATDSAALGDTEGEMVPATVLFPNDSLRRAVIVCKTTSRSAEFESCGSMGHTKRNGEHLKELRSAHR
jgi:hypothetical protein